MSCRPHPVPFASVGDTIRYRRGKGTKSGVVLSVATGMGWPCYDLGGGVWVGHEEIRP